jgi:sugar lactone lactonase YvrE
LVRKKTKKLFPCARAAGKLPVNAKSLLVLFFKREPLEGNPMRHRATLAVAFLTLAGAPALAQVRDTPAPSPPAPNLTPPAKLQLVAHFPDQQITGVAVADDGRVFVNLPRWTVDVPISVGVLKDGAIAPYPDAAWNGWRNSTHVSPADHFVCVQSVVADGLGSLWVLDPAAPAMSGPVKGGPKLVRIDLKTNKVVKTIRFDGSLAPAGSYLNDIRFSPDGKIGYISDSGVQGAILVVDLTTGIGRRVLAGDKSTQADPSVTVTIGGHALQRPDGRRLQIGVDGIAVSGDGGYLYYQALVGKALYRVPTASLLDAHLTPAQLSAKVERVQASHPADGLWIDSQNRLYVTNPETDSIESAMPGKALTTLARDKRLLWPDSFAQGPGGTLYISASHIQDSPWFKPGAKVTASDLFRVIQ